MTLYFIIGGIGIIAATLLVLVVVIQNSKGGGINSAFGSSNLSAMIGSRRATQDIEKLTWYLAAGVLVFCLATTFAAKGAKTTVEDGSSKLTRGIENLNIPFNSMPQAPAPAQPGQPAPGGAPGETE